jgi:cytochrome c5
MMNRFVGLATAVAVVAGVTYAQRSARAASPVRGAEPTRTVWDSVYADSQVARGDSIYKESCIKCHGTKLEGVDDGAPLVGDQFFGDWDGKVLGDLADEMRNTMPSDNPKSLSRAQVTQLIALILARNNFPSGARALSADSDSLKDIKLVKTKP